MYMLYKTSQFACWQLQFIIVGPTSDSITTGTKPKAKAKPKVGLS